ncbi:MAG TPA: hypothetical protein VJ697_08395 [Nitrososphaeraceae archaeon]|nr:hypothetical protein [Nitrososphaeraceae archaeon]
MEESTAYSLFLYAFRSPVTKDCYLRRMKTFFNFINFLPDGNLEEKCNLFTIKGLEDPKWAFNNIIKFFAISEGKSRKDRNFSRNPSEFYKNNKIIL